MFVRRYLRFSLKTFLGVVTILALLIGFKANQARRQESAVDTLVEAGGQFTYDYQVVSRSKVTGRIEGLHSDIPIPGPKWLREHLGKHYFVKPVRLLIRREGRITPQAFERLEDLPYLEELFLYQTGLSDELMACLPSMDNLRSLRIESSTTASENRNVRDFSFLRRLPNLQELELPFSSFRDSDAKYLSSTTALKRLNLSYTDLGDAGLQKMKLGRVVRLNIAGTNITDSSLSYLGSLSELQYLNLNGTRISDAGLASLRSLTQLRSLALVNTPITDGAAEYLMSISSLTQLKLVSTNVSDSGINTIHESLPNCSIQVDWGRWVEK